MQGMHDREYGPVSEAQRRWGMSPVQRLAKNGHTGGDTKQTQIVVSPYFKVMHVELKL